MARIDTLPLDIFEDPDDEQAAELKPDASGTPEAPSPEETVEVSEDAAGEVMCQWCGAHFVADLEICPECGARAVNPEMVLQEPEEPPRLSASQEHWDGASGAFLVGGLAVDAESDLGEDLAGEAIDLLGKLLGF